jgi:hypothetical protein
MLSRPHTIGNQIFFFNMIISRAYFYSHPLNIDFALIVNILGFGNKLNTYGAAIGMMLAAAALPSTR